MSIASIRPSADLRNHYKEISQLVRETRRPVIITLNGREDTAVLGFQDYQQMVAELELLRTLAEAEEDAAAGRVASLADTLQALRKALPKESSK